MLSLAILVGEPSDALEAPPSADRLDKFNDCILALAADGKVQVASVQGGIGVVGGEKSSPNDRNVGVARSDLPARGYGGHSLRSRHHCNGQQLDRLLAEQRQHRFCRVGI